jgi:predicted dehydrogenase
MTASGRRVRVAVAGLGGIGLMHAGNIARCEGAELVAVASTTPERATEVAGELGPGVQAFTHAQLPASNVDAVVLCCRAREHVRYAVPLLEAGKHVLLEKPGATTLADHDRLRTAAQAAPGSLLQIAYMRRFDPLFSEAHRLISAGAIGEPLVVRMTSRDQEFPADEDPFDTGGFLLDMAVHDYDTACWMLGQRPVRVSAERQALVHPQLLEVGDLDNAIVTVAFDGGGLATSHISRTCAFGHDIRAEIMGSSGSIFVGNGAGGPGVTVLDFATGDRFPSDYQARFADAFKAEIGRFIAACTSVLSGADAATAAAETSSGAAATLDDDRRAVETGIAARASAVAGRPLTVGEDWPWPTDDDRARADVPRDQAIAR